MILDINLNMAERLDFNEIRDAKYGDDVLSYCISPSKTPKFKHQEDAYLDILYNSNQKL